jgi:farnesyl diphosphate synthase
MAGGQAIDLDSTGTSLSLEALETMHRMKTGALIRVAVRLGAACGRPLAPAEDTALDAYARAAGLAFQVVDDVLDVEGSAATLGKTAGKDAAQGKPTFVSLLGLPAAKARAETLRAEASAALAPFGRSARRLAELADWIVLRSH